MLCSALLSAGIALASPQTDRLAELAAKGDRTSIKSLVDLARKKDADAEYALGLLTYEGRGLARNLKQAYRLFERAAGRGHAEAQNTLLIDALESASPSACSMAPCRRPPPSTTITVLSLARFFAISGSSGGQRASNGLSSAYPTALRESSTNTSSEAPASQRPQRYRRPQ